MANILKKIMSYFRSDNSQKENTESNRETKSSLKNSLFEHIETLKSKTSKSKIFSKTQEQKTKHQTKNQNR